MNELILICMERGCLHLMNVNDSPTCTLSYILFTIDDVRGALDGGANRWKKGTSASPTGSAILGRKDDREILY